jgi:hypothetical protein
MKNDVLCNSLSFNDEYINELNALNKKRKRYVNSKREAIVSLIKMGFKFSDVVQYSRCDVSILCYSNLVKSLLNKGVSIAIIKDLEAYNHTTNKEVLYGLPIMEQLIETKISTDLIIDFLKSPYKPMRLLLKLSPILLLMKSLLLNVKKL